MAPTTRQRMISAAGESLRRHGLAGTSFTEVLAASGAARGAVYHHFPGGKAELVASAVTQVGDGVRTALDGLAPAADVPEVVDAFLELVRPVVIESAAGAGCAVGAVATEVAPTDPLGELSGQIFGSWRAILAQRLAGAGAEPAEADGLAALLIITLEGAHVLCRADGSIAPFDAAAATLRAAFDAR